MKFEDIKKANETIVTTDVKGKQYAEVNQRIKAFRMVYPEGYIHTHIVSLEKGICVMSAEVGYYREHTTIVDSKDGKQYGDTYMEKVLLGTGTAYEVQNSTFINKTSYIENCETSCVGRALAMCGFGIDTSIASKEEVENAIAQQDEEKKLQDETKQLLIKIRLLMKEKGVLPNEPSEHFGKPSNEMTNDELEEVIKWLEEK